MIRIVYFALFSLFILTACNSSILSISEIEIVPDEVQNAINPKLTLQLIHDDGEEASYIVYHSNSTVTADLETQGETLKVNLDEMDTQGDVLEQNVYKLTLDSEYEVIDVLINGESIPFDNVTYID